MTSTTLTRPQRFDQRETAVAFGELLARVHEACQEVDRRFERCTRHGPAVAVTRSFFMLELRKLQGLFFVPPGLFAAGTVQGQRQVETSLRDAIAFFEAHASQSTAFIEYLFTLNETLAVRAWTVLEATARNLWVEALDGHPRSAQLFWRSPAPPRLVAKNTNRSRKRRAPKAQPPPPAKIGSSLKDCSFSSPFALAERFAPMNDVFAEELRNNVSLRRLNSARHIIVHRAGVIDEKFVSETGLQVQVGFRLGPRFSDVAAWTEAAVTSAYACCEVVDAWEQRVDPGSVVSWPPFFG